MLTLVVVLLLIALGLAVAAAVNRAPLWTSVFVAVVANLIALWGH